MEQLNNGVGRPPEFLRDPHGPVLLTGRSNQPLARDVGFLLGIEPSCAANQFPDGELKIGIGESVRRKDVLLSNPLRRQMLIPR